MDKGQFLIETHLRTRRPVGELAGQQAQGDHADRISPHFRECGRSHVAPRIGHRSKPRANDNWGRPAGGAFAW